MFCTRCGEKLEDGCAFCTKCGARMRDEASPAIVAAEGLQALRAAGDSACAANPIAGQGATSSPKAPEKTRFDGDSSERNAQAKRGNVALIVGIAAAAVVLIAALVAIGVFALGPKADDSPTSMAVGSVAYEGAEAGDSSRPESESENPAEEDALTQDAGGESASDGPVQEASGEAGEAPGEVGPLEEMQGAEAESAYIFPDIDSRYYNTSDIASLSDWELYVGRNEVFARYGRSFQNADLVEYFSSQSWYEPLFSPEEFDAMESPLNDYEKQNLDVIMAEERRRGSSYLS